MAVGEAACVSVHGANRLGSNSLIDLVVFGRAAATARRNVIDRRRGTPRRCRKTRGDNALARFDALRNAKGGRRRRRSALEMQKTMQTDCRACSAPATCWTKGNDKMDARSDKPWTISRSPTAR